MGTLGSEGEDTTDRRGPRLSPSGKLISATRIGQAKRDVSLAGIAPAESGWVVAGQSATLDYSGHPQEAGHADAFLARLGADLSVTWRHTISGDRLPDGQFQTSAEAVAAPPNRTVLLGGSTGHAYDTFPEHNPYQQVLAAYSPGGLLQWANTFGRDGRDYVLSLVMFRDTAYALGEHALPHTWTSLREVAPQGRIAWRMGGAQDVRARAAVASSDAIFALLGRRRLAGDVPAGSLVLVKLKPVE